MMYNSGKIQGGAAMNLKFMGRLYINLILMAVALYFLVMQLGSTIDITSEGWTYLWNDSPLVVYNIIGEIIFIFAVFIFLIFDTVKKIRNG